MQRQNLLNKFYSEASINGCKELAEELIRLGANYHKRESEETVALMQAAKNGDIEKVKKLSEEDVNLVDYVNKTALMYASENGQLTIVSYLVEKKADVLMTGDWGDHALKLAAGNGHIEVVKTLLEEMSTKETGNWPLTDALEKAIGKNHTEIANVIAEKLEQVSIKALQHAVENNDIEMAKKLIPKAISTLDSPVGFNGHYTLLGLAAEKGFLEMSKLLLEEGASVNKQYQYGATPLYLAAESGHLEIVNLLLNDYGADPNLYDRGSLIQYTPLMKAAENNHYEIVKALAEKNADLNAFSTGVRKTALMWAVEKGAEESVRELIEAGADLNLREKSGYEFPALSMAAEGSNIEKMLRDAGAKTIFQLPHC